MFLLVVAGGVRAETITHDYKAVMHVHESHSMSVLDSSDHVVGVAAFRGIAMFADDEIVVHRYDGWFDLIAGSGSFHGHALWRFEDGSELRAVYEGKADAASDGGITFTAEFHDFEGSGRYEGAAGEGGYAGRRLEAFEVGGSTYLSGSLKLTLPE